MTQWPPFLFGAAKANQQNCMSISSHLILGPGRIIWWKIIPRFSGFSYLCPMSPCFLLYMSWVTIPPSLLSIESQMPPQANYTKYFSIPYLCPLPLPQILPQSQLLPLTQIQPQIHLQCILPILRSGPIPQIRICRVCFHCTHNHT